MDVRPARTLRFGDFDLDVRARELRKHGVRIRLQDQSFQILLMLLERPGEVVLREEIRQKLWPNNTIVEFDHSINAAIKRLRNALSESAEEPRYIETLAKRGYRFGGEIEGSGGPLPAPSGSVVSHYRLLDKLGEGGLGVVYRAEDLNLGRFVAVKFLRLGDDGVPESRLGRFEREARAASALNHPNICTIYGLENFDGQAAIVMELVEGETLAARLARGALVLNNALAVAIQIADALDEAHRKGIVHRDLKPDNIMLTGRSSSGLGVKVLDFGIAKMESSAVQAAPSSATQPGVALGTWNYMSPEQAEGKATDARSDIYSFGVVLQEMLAGQRTRDGDWSKTLPASVERVLARCLEQDREDRWQSARDLKAELKWIAEQPAAAPALQGGSAWRGRLEWTGVGVLAALLIGVPTLLLREKPSDRLVARFSIDAPENTRFGTTPTPVVSPDGRWIAVAMNPNLGPARIWLRSLDSVTAVPLAGTEGVNFPFWSPDSKSIAFFADGKLKRIDLGGPSGAGPPILLCAAAEPIGGGSWNRKGTIIFAEGESLYRVRDTGGSPALVTKDRARQGSVFSLLPWFLPDDQHFLFEEFSSAGSWDRTTIRIGSLDSPESKMLREAGSQPIYTRGYLLFLQDGALMAQQFDTRKLVIVGDPVRLAGQIMLSPSTPGLGFFNASENGPLIYITDDGVPPFELAWFDRSGRRLSTLGETASFGSNVVGVAPDQKTAAISASEHGNTDIWLFDAARGFRTRLTFDPAREIDPVWSPDNRTVAFSSNRKGHLDLYRRSADGTGPDELLYADTDDKYLRSWSPDGKFLLYNRIAGSVPQLWVLPLMPVQARAALDPFSLFDPPDWKSNGSFSPDGRWIAYDSVESGNTQVFVAPFRSRGGPQTAKWQVSRTSGSAPQWRSDGKEIFYRSGRSLMATEVRIKRDSMEIGEERQVFAPLMTIYAYAVSDGQRFLFLLRNSRLTSESITVVENWTTLLKK